MLAFFIGGGGGGDNLYLTILSCKPSFSLKIRNLIQIYGGLVGECWGFAQDY